MITFGNISNVDNAKGLVRVNFEQDNFVSGWLPLAVNSSLGVRTLVASKVGAPVAVLFDDRAENGIVLQIYDAEHAPPVADGQGIEFATGDEQTYSAGEYLIKMQQTAIKLDEQGVAIKTATESLKTILNDLISEIQLLSLPTASGPPVNAANFALIALRLENLFTE